MICSAEARGGTHRGWMLKHADQGQLTTACRLAPRARRSCARAIAACAGKDSEGSQQGREGREGAKLRM